VKYKVRFLVDRKVFEIFCLKSHIAHQTTYCDSVLIDGFSINSHYCLFVSIASFFKNSGRSLVYYPAIVWNKQAQLFSVCFVYDVRLTKWNWIGTKSLSIFYRNVYSCYSSFSVSVRDANKKHNWLLISSLLFFTSFLSG
jgi:hypothetical protein